MRLYRHALGAILLALISLGFAPVQALAADYAPTNLAPNSQWEIMSGWNFGTQENHQGTGTVAPIAASANSTDTIGRTTFTVKATGSLSVGDLVKASGSGIDPCVAVSPMRIVAFVADTSITVRTPYGCMPSINHAATLLPVTAGNQSIIMTGSGPDGWHKTPTMAMWRNENRGPYAANMPADIGAYAALGMTKDTLASEHLYISVPPQNLGKFRGKTMAFGIYGYQKVRGSEGTWTIFTTDNINGERALCANAATTPGYQWLECSFDVPMGATFFYVGARLDGAASDTYYFVNPVFAVGNSIGGVKNYQKPENEILIPQVHISPYGWINAEIRFPASPAPYCGTFLTCFEHDLYAETGGAIAPTVTKCHGQMEGINARPVVTGSPFVRLMAWYDRSFAPEKSGSFLSQYAANVKSFAYMDFPLNQTDPSPDILGTGIYTSTVVSDVWSNVSEEIDWCVLN